MQLSSPILLLLAAMSLAPAAARADAVLFIYPTIITFEGTQRSAEIILTNRGDETGTFETSWSDMTMTVEGGLMKYEGSAPWSVQSYVRHSPRRVTLAPAESQVIKIALRRSRDVPEGEYYSHFRVLTLNSEDPSASAADAAQPAAVPGVKIKARTAIAIPVIWRNSQAASSASIESARFRQGTNELTVAVRRHGLLSVRGYLHLFEAAPDGNASSLADPVPLVIYPSIEVRATTIALRDGVTADSLPRDVRLYYSPDLEMTGKSIVFASFPILP